MFEGLVNNFTILTTFLFFGNMVRINYLNNNGLNKFTNELLVGIVLGLFGVALMFFTFPLNEDVFADFRHLPVMISVILGGGTSGLASSLIISLYRLYYLGGVSLISELGAINVMITFVIAMILLRKHKLSFIRWTYALLLTLIASNLFYYKTLQHDIGISITIFSIVYLLGGLFTFAMLQYLKRSDDLIQLMKEAANRDFLTGLYNVRAFDALMEHKSRVTSRTHAPFAVLMVDIDHFKTINDTYGHLAGDNVLAELAEIFRDTFRPDDHIARKGGEEFIILVDRCNKEQIAIIAERLRSNVEKHKFRLPDGNEIGITISAGSATYPDVKMDEMVEKSDQALYRAKSSGRNRVCYTIGDD